MKKTYVVFDLETTGLREDCDEIIEIGALKVADGKVVNRFLEFLKPERPISPAITQLTGITNAMVRDARRTEEVIADFMRFCGEDVLVGHNLPFDYKFIKRYAARYGYPFEKSGIDTLKIARKVHRDLESRSLEFLCAHYGIDNRAAHRAYHDALATAKLYHYLAHEFEEAEPKLFVPQALACKPKKIQPMTAKQKAYMEKLSAWHGIGLPENAGQMSRSEASRWIDGVISVRGNFKEKESERTGEYGRREADMGGE